MTDLMDAPSVVQHQCVICGEPKDAQHHVVYRSQGGTEGPTLAVCGRGNADKCHGAIHAGHVKFSYSEQTGWWWRIADGREARRDRLAITRRRRNRLNLKVEVAAMRDYPCYVAPEEPDAIDVPLMVADAINDSAAEQEAAMTAAERELLEAAQYAGASGYYLAESIRKVMASYADPDAGMDAVDAVLKGRLKPSQVTRYKAWASLPDTPGVKAMGLTRAYALSRLSEQRVKNGGIGLSDKAANPDDPYTWKDWDYDVLGKVPSDELPKVECPLGAGACARAAKEN